MTRIFVSYRRADADVAGRITDRLIDEFGQEAVFLDVDDIPVGVEFRQAIHKAISQTSCLLALIGPDWLRRLAEHDEGAPRENETDYVRYEIETALAHKRPVIPVLVGATSLPRAADLPASIRDIVSINACAIRSGHGFRADVELLLSAVREQHPHNTKAKASSTTQDAQRVSFASTTLINTPRLLEGEHLGRYELHTFLAAGGSGAVYSAFDKNLFRQVCVKAAFPLNESATHIKGLVAKGVRGVVKMQHPRVVPILDFDEFVFDDHARSFFLVMELVQGRDLTTWSSTQGDDVPGLRRRIRCAHSIASTLNDAHQFRYIGADGIENVGVLHGDIKPNNIVVDDSDTPRVLDFLMVDIHQLQSMPRPTWSERSHPVTAGFGTPTYMAPEQERQGIVTSKTDVYSFGRTLAALFCKSPIATGALAGDSGMDLRTLADFCWGGQQALGTLRSLRPLIAESLAPLPSERPTMALIAQQLAKLVDAPFDEQDAAPTPPRSPTNRSTVVFCTRCAAPYRAQFEPYRCPHCSTVNTEDKTMHLHEACGGYSPLDGQFCRRCGESFQPRNRS